MLARYAVEVVNARPLGALSPEAKVLLVPAGVNLKMVPLP
jgi:hypothetical protein